MRLQMRLAMLSMLVVLGSRTIVHAQEDASEPQAVVQRLHDALLEVMKEGETLDYQGRFERLAPVVEEVDDLPYIARLALGKHWASLTTDQQTLFVDTFTELSIASYASRFNDFSGQRFETTKVAELPRGGVQVRTKLITPEGRTVHLDYLLQKRSEQWRVVNILAEGVSDLAIKRSEFDNIMEETGFDGLITKLEEKIALLADLHE